jgi:hypothetical protein
MTAMVVVGFWPSYIGPLLRGSAVRPAVIHFHGAIFAGWMILLIAQVVFAARGHLTAHRKLGSIGIVYGGVVLIMGLIVTFAAPVLHVRAGDWSIDRAAAFIPVPLGDMVLFGGFFGSAIAYRRRPQIHKRLMVLATVALAFAAAGRMIAFIGVLPALVVWLSPLAVAIAYDRIARRRVHAAYWIGFASLLMLLPRMAAGASETWMHVGRIIVRGLL